ncbi:MAG: PAS domain-containing protein [Candidatus Aegiribacteria sp.]
MLLFPRVSFRTVTWALTPYILGLLAITAVLLGYFHFTSGAVDRIVSMERERAVRTAESLIELLDSGIENEIFEAHVVDGHDVIGLRPDFLSLMGLTEFQVVSFPEGVQPEGTFFERDSLARSALEGRTAVSAYLERGKDDNLLIFYPLTDSGGNTALAGIVFEDVLDRDSLIESRYTLYLMSAVVILLVLLPGIFLKLAEIRRGIEKAGFYQNDMEYQSKKTDGTAGTDICPPSLLEGDEFPAVFRLDGNGSILFMNRSAEKLMDITRDDIKGSLFHELPCFHEDDRDRIVYPREDATGMFKLNIVDSRGTARRATFVMERLDSTGYAVSIRTVDKERKERGEAPDGPAAAGSAKDRPAAAAGDGRVRAIALMKEGRFRFRKNEAVVEYFARLQDALAGSGDGLESPDEGTTEIIDISSELDSISSALNDVLPERASIKLDIPDFLPEVMCSREDFTQIVKNMVFYSLESHTGPFRIVLGAREVPSPVSDHVFSANCDRTVPRSVALSYTDGTRIPVVLKEALMDPETDLSGIQRDFGTHISSVAAVLSSLDCHPVFTEGTMGSSMNILFKVSDNYLFDRSQGEVARTIDLSRMSLAVCEASRAVRDSVSDVLELYGINVMRSSDLDEMREMLADSGADHLVLDRSAVLEPVEDVLEELGSDFPALRIILTGGPVLREMNVPEAMERKVRILEKPYAVEEILNIVELTMPRRDAHDRPENRAGRDI